MKYKKIKNYYRVFMHRFGTTNNLVLAAAVLVGGSWAWSSIGVMQRNYDLQGEITRKERQLELAKLETKLTKYQRDYHKSTEFQELAARRDIGLVDPGERVLILPGYKKAGAQADEQKNAPTVQLEAERQPSNLKQWRSFLFGHNHKSLQRDK